MKNVAIFTALFALSLLVGCDHRGIYPLGVRRDVIVQCDKQETWVRTIEGKTEIFVIGVYDEKSIPIGEDGEPEAEVGVCFNHGTVEHASTTKLRSGALIQDELTGEYTVHFIREYNFVHEPHLPMGQREGANGDDYPSPLVIPGLTMEVAEDGDSMILNFEGEARRLHRMGAVLARLKPDSTDQEEPGGAEDIMRFVNLSLYTSQCRVTAFGSFGMTQYVNRTSTFSALINGEFSVNVRQYIPPTVDITYYDYEELAGIVISGVQTTLPDLGGSGPMEGTLEYELYLNQDDTEPYITGHLNYDDVAVENGVAASGWYNFRVGDRDFELPWQLAVDATLENVLPIEEGIP